MDYFEEDDMMDEECIEKLVQLFENIRKVRLEGFLGFKNDLIDLQTYTIKCPLCEDEYKIMTTMPREDWEKLYYVYKKQNWNCGQVRNLLTQLGYTFWDLSLYSVVKADEGGIKYDN